MNEKILVIHPNNEYYGFEIFQNIYKDRACTVITDSSISDGFLRILIERHDAIVIIGCFIEEGLLARNAKTGKDFILINETYVDLLKQKRVYSIGGKDYFTKHKVLGLHTGVILTSGFQASLYEIDATEEEIVCSALRLMTIIGDALEISHPREIEAKIFAEYDGIAPVSLFNKKGIIAL